MTEVLKELVKQPYWVLTLVLGVVAVTFPCVTIDKDYRWISHPPSTLYPVIIGIGLLVTSVAGFGWTLWSKRPTNADPVGGLDLTRVKESNGVLSTTVGGCEIRVVEGRLEDHTGDAEVTVALPCNEYFDDRCVEDKGSALGAYVNRVFEGQGTAFVSLMKDECRKKFGVGEEQQKTDDERATSFGPGRCVLLVKPLGPGRRHRQADQSRWLLYPPRRNEPARDLQREFPICSMVRANWSHAWLTRDSTKSSCRYWELATVVLTHPSPSLVFFWRSPKLLVTGREDSASKQRRLLCLSGTRTVLQT